MENFPVTIHTSTASTATSSPILREKSPPHSIYSRYSTHPTINIALTAIFNMVVTSSRNDRGLNWFSLTDFVSLSSTNKTFHIKSELIWKYLLIHQNHGCLKEKALLDPTIFKIVFLQLNRFKISFENPHSVFKLARAGSLNEMQSMLNANSNQFDPDNLRGDRQVFDPAAEGFMAHLSEYIDQIKQNGQKYGWTPFIYAARAGDIYLMQALLSYKHCKDPDSYMTTINAQTRIGSTALIHAANQGQLEMVHFLIEKNADVTACDSWGRFASTYAIAKFKEFAERYSDLKCAREKGANVDNEKEAITFIAYTRQSDIVDALQKRLAELKKQENHETEERALKRLKVI